MFVGGLVDKFAGTGCCRSTMVTLMASGLDGPVGPVTVNLRVRLVAKGLMFGHASQLPAGPAVQVPAETGVHSAAVVIQSTKLHV